MFPGFEPVPGWVSNEHIGTAAASEDRPPYTLDRSQTRYCLSQRTPTFDTLQ